MSLTIPTVVTAGGADRARPAGARPSRALARDRTPRNRLRRPSRRCSLRKAARSRPSRASPRPRCRCRLRTRRSRTPRRRGRGRSRRRSRCRPRRRRPRAAARLADHAGARLAGDAAAFTGDAGLTVRAGRPRPEVEARVGVVLPALARGRLIEADHVTDGAALVAARREGLDVERVGRSSPRPTRSTCPR